MQNRIARARAMAAAHNLTAATFELDAILKSATDDAVRDIARIMLMGIYLEEADYERAKTLLKETFKARSAQKEATLRAYFALAGQSVNGARAHLERYRAFGIDIADKNLPTEAINDLDRLRSLLERIADQAKEISEENSRNTDAVALLEDVASMRGTLARDKEEQRKWQREFANARQKLATSETRLASTRTVTSHSSTVATTNAPPDDSNKVAATSSDSSKTSQDGTPAIASDTTRGQAPTGQSDSSGNAQGGSAPQDERLVEVGSLVEKATEKVSPSYPQVARNQRITGIVKVYLVVDETGSVASVQRSSGPPLLLQAAVDAARRWKFRPTMVDGQPVRVVGFINFNFTL